MPHFYRAKRIVRWWVTQPRLVARRVRRYLDPFSHPYAKRYAMTIREWMINHQRSIHFEKCSWMGVASFKNPCDAWIYQEIIYEVKPEVIVEIGSAYGGTTLFFAHLLDLMGTGSVVSVDIDRSHYAVQHPRITTITGDSSCSDVIAQVQQQCHGKRVLVVHDGDHSRGQVLKDLRAYQNLVTIGSYLIVEDGVIDLFDPGDGIGTLSPGPLPAIKQFLQEHHNYLMDATRERYVITYNPRGFLRRIS